jgi:hypothetical protein
MASAAEAPTRWSRGAGLHRSARLGNAANQGARDGTRHRSGSKSLRGELVSRPPRWHGDRLGHTLCRHIHGCTSRARRGGILENNIVQTGGSASTLLSPEGDLLDPDPGDQELRAVFDDFWTGGTRRDTGFPPLRTRRSVWGFHQGKIVGGVLRVNRARRARISAAPRC